MRTYNDFDEYVALCNRLAHDARSIGDEVMEDYEEYCEMKQYSESEEYWLDAANDELARQWDNIVE